LLTRNGNDWGERFPAVVKALERLDVKSCLIDGRPDSEQFRIVPRTSVAFSSRLY
jgi:ATP-dependent DNA ligase